MPFKVDLTPDRLDLAFYAGDIGDFQISFVDADNAPIDVSSYTWQSQIRAARSSDSPVVLAVDVTEATLGIIVVKIPATLTRSLVSDAMSAVQQWDIQCYLPGTDPITILQGSVTCSQDVTR